MILTGPDTRRQGFHPKPNATKLRGSNARTGSPMLASTGRVGMDSSRSPSILYRATIHIAGAELTSATGIRVRWSPAVTLAAVVGHFY